MAVVTMRQLLEAGVHFGHQTRRWNPKMRRFIFGERNGIYIIDLKQTLERVEVAYSFVRDLVANGGSVLFVGTKKQSQDPVARAAQLCNMPYINERWLGGMLTNFATIAGRVKKMQELERMRKSGDFDAMPKKEALMHSRELEKLERNLGGIRDMERVPDAVFIIDIKKEHIAVSEANKMGIPIVAVVDTNCDPDLVQYVIPGNDDAIRSGTLMCRVIAEAVQEGRYVASRRGIMAPPQPEAEAPKPAVLSPARHLGPGRPLGHTGVSHASAGRARVNGVAEAPPAGAVAQTAPPKVAPEGSSALGETAPGKAPTEAPAPAADGPEAVVDVSATPEAMAPGTGPTETEETEPATTGPAPDQAAGTAEPAPAGTETNSD
jgi:small subunit ribosomal protein S2